MNHLHPHPSFLPFFLLLLILSTILHLSHGEVGTSAQYAPPFLPTACYGNDPGQFPSSNLFAAVGDGLWGNGAACGRQYLVKCISASDPGTCVPDQVIQVRIVDFALTTVSSPSYDGTTMVLSDTAFGTIANSSAMSINIEFQRPPAAEHQSVFVRPRWRASFEEWHWRIHLLPYVFTTVRCNDMINFE